MSELLEVRLHRDERIPDGVFGRLTGLGIPPLQTCEEDWRNNVPGKSCIPAGTYRCRRKWSPRFKIETFEICDAPGRPPVLDKRDPILFHPGNTEEDTEGCVLLGMERTVLSVPDDEDTPGKDPKRKRAVSSSRVAWRKFMNALAGVEEFVLQITWAEAVAP